MRFINILKPTYNIVFLKAQHLSSIKDTNYAKGFFLALELGYRQHTYLEWKEFVIDEEVSFWLWSSNWPLLAQYVPGNFGEAD